VCGISITIQANAADKESGSEVEEISAPKTKKNSKATQVKQSKTATKAKAKATEVKQRKRKVT
jgi:hypothetical protein